ncbi:MAG: hypothetical protein NW205_10940 [Hyphomicrobiaceae bacterium]|nr:hypothetical protein [Hyphomicrobiaceae bacterium]
MAREVGVSARTISQRARRECWIRAEATARAADASVDTARRGRRQRDTGAAKPPLTERLLAAIELKLTLWEKRMTSGAETSAADSEREARELASMIRSYEAVAELAAPGKPRADANDGSATHGSPADAERRREEIAQRLERLFQHGQAETGAGGTERG